jgi:two-component system sensor kinase FixL
MPNPLNVDDGDVWKTMLQSTVDSIMVIDESGRVLAANHATENMFGYPLEEVIGQNVKMLMTSADKERHDSYIQRFLTSREPRVIGIGREVVGQHRKGHQIDLDLAVSEAVLGTDRVFVGILRDITERRVLQRAHSQFIANVSHEV